MLDVDKRKSIDLLVEEFWKQGYLTLSRKYGTYLPEPSKVGLFDVDIIARYKKNIAIGITLNEDDFRNPDLIKKLDYLASRRTKYSNKKVLLFVGVPERKMKTIKILIEAIVPETRKNIKLLPIVERSVQLAKNPGNRSSLFS